MWNTNYVIKTYKTNSMKEGALQRKSTAFGVRIINMKKHLQNEHREFEMSSQVVRSGTSISANIHEAFSAQSDSDFIAKLYISLKEASETRNWLELLYKTNYITDIEYSSIYPECVELATLLIHTIKKKKATMKRR